MTTTKNNTDGVESDSNDDNNNNNQSEVSAGARIDTMILQFEYRKAGIINVELHVSNT